MLLLNFITVTGGNKSSHVAVALQNSESTIDYT